MDIQYYEGFCENFTYRMSINKERMTTAQGENDHSNSLIYCISLFEKSIEVDIQLFDDPVDTDGS